MVCLKLIGREDFICFNTDCPNIQAAKFGNELKTEDS
jgi:hypothetical protein